MSGGTIPLYSLDALHPVSHRRHLARIRTHPSVAMMLRKVSIIPIPPLPVASCCRVLTTSRGYSSCPRCQLGR